MNKIEATKYILLQLCNWYYDLNPSKKKSDHNDISVLKALKLIFLLSTVKSGDKKLLNNPFNDFRAMPLGPVESDVYDFFKQNENLIDNKKTYCDNISYELDSNHKNIIDSIIDELKKINIDLINKSAFYMVDLTHEWDCWKKSFKRAEENNKNSEPMTIDEILNSDTYYSY